MNGDQSLDAFMALEALALEARHLQAGRILDVQACAARLLRQVEFVRSAIACAEVDE